MNLFIDSCDYLTLGLLNDKLSWVDYDQISSQKNSEIFHGRLFEMLERGKTSLDKIENVFQIAGPGSYTGMRLSEGLSQLLEWHKIKVYSLYHFEIPELLGIENGVWLSEAFKGELFCYSWQKGSSKMELMAKNGKDNEEFVAMFYGQYDHVFTHYPSGAFDCEYSTELIRKSPELLFSKVLTLNLRREPYYYRPLDKEFKQSFK